MGALVLHVDPRAFLIPFMHDVPTQENTLESWLLVNLNHTPRGFRTQNGNVYFDRRCRFKGYRTKWVGVRAQVVDRSVAHQLRIHCLFTDITLRTEHELAQERISIEVALKNAVRQQQLRVHYQPQVSLASGRIKGAEALVRWQYPTLGVVAPAYFIRVAEESGLIADIGDWVLKETCRQIRRWREQGYEGMVFAVNVSPKQMVYNELTESVRQALAQSGIPAECLALKITESSLMAAGDKAVRQFQELQALGVRIAIDDFGTGYSSLAYLKNLPLDVLKIDKQFVDDIPDNEDGMQIVNTIIAMAHSLHLKVLAEAVETETQRDFLAL